MPTTVLAVLAGLLGAALGSFANIVAARLPRGESLQPGSRCPHCGTRLRAVDSIPIIGWLLLGGRCRTCRRPIPARDPIVEALTAVLAAAIVLARHSAVDRTLGLVLLAVLVPVSLIDLDTRKIPNRITGPAAVAAVVLGLLLDISHVPAQLLAGAAGFLFLFVFALAYPRGLGMGDVKLAGVLGLFLKASVAVALFAGVISGALFGLGVMARLGVARGRKTGIPFGPFLAFGGLVAILAGPQIVHWYVHSVAG